MTIHPNADHDAEIRIYHASPDTLTDTEPAGVLEANWPTLAKLTDVGLRRKIATAFSTAAQHDDHITLVIEDTMPGETVRQTWRPRSADDEEMCKHQLDLAATNLVAQWRQEPKYE